MIQTKGARVVDAPVSGGDVGAQQGQLSIMLAGDPMIAPELKSCWQRPLNQLDM
jgi:3-hydroxyisobutyrate dehydrogenase-like beta-hydroxyacid dehydrogenase